MSRDIKRGFLAPQKNPSHSVGRDGKALKSKLWVVGKKRSCISGGSFRREDPGAYQAGLCRTYPGKGC